MREILFRGKTKDGKWVEGFLFNSQLCRIFWATAFKKEEDNIFYCEGKDVNPETVGQFTGLTDKNGKKIFEGDIVKGEFFGFPMTIKDFIFAIYWDEETKGFMANYFGEVEVIGNIHDNPELLGETK